MTPDHDDLQEQIGEIKTILADISATLAEMQQRPCQIKKHKQALERPFEDVPHTYSLMLDTAVTQDDLCIVGIIHLLPDRGKAHGKQVTDAALHFRTPTHALLSTIGVNLKTIITYCPEKLVIYTGSKLIEKVLKHQKVKIKDPKEKQMADYLVKDIDALAEMFPVEVRHGIPEGHKNEIKSLLAQAELGYIRQKEKSDGTGNTRNRTDNRGTKPSPSH